MTFIVLSNPIHFYSTIVMVIKSQYKLQQHLEKKKVVSRISQYLNTDRSLVVRLSDRRRVFANLRTHISERLLQIDNQTRTVLASNRIKKLKIYLYFTEPVANSSAEIMNSIRTNQGSLVPINGSSLGERRFGYQVSFRIYQAQLNVVLWSLVHNIM